MLFLCGGTNKCSFRKQRLIDYCNIGSCADRSQYSLDAPYGSISAESIRAGRLPPHSDVCNTSQERNVSLYLCT